MQKGARILPIFNNMGRVEGMTGKSEDQNNKVLVSMFCKLVILISNYSDGDKNVCTVHTQSRLVFFEIYEKIGEIFYKLLCTDFVMCDL